MCFPLSWGHVFGLGGKNLTVISARMQRNFNQVPVDGGRKLEEMHIFEAEIAPTLKLDVAHIGVEMQAFLANNTPQIIPPHWG